MEFHFQWDAIPRKMGDWGWYNCDVNTGSLPLPQLFTCEESRERGMLTERQALQLLGTLRNHDGNANENVTWLLVLLCAYSNAFNFYNVAELSSNRTGGNGLQVSTENENLLSRARALHKTSNLSISSCCLAEDGDEMYQNL